MTLTIGDTTTRISATIPEVLAGVRAPHEMSYPLATLWRDGFHAGQHAAGARVARAEREADRWYYIANNGPEIRAQHAAVLRAFDVALARKTTAEKWAALDRIAAERSEGAL